MGAKIFFIILLIMTATGCAYTRTVPPGQLAVQKIVSIPGLSKEEIFDRSKIWIARTFRQPVAGFSVDNWPRTVIQLEDKKEWVLVASSSILYPHADFTSETYKEGWEVRFTLEEYIKEGKAMLVFSNMVMYVPPHICGYYYPGPTSPYLKELTVDETERIMPVFDSFPEKLELFLNGKGVAGEW